MQVSTKKLKQNEMQVNTKTITKTKINTVPYLV